MSLAQLLNATRSGLNIQKRNSVRKMYMYVFLGLRVKTESFLFKKISWPMNLPPWS